MEEEVPSFCENCFYAVKESKYYDSEKEKWLCKICSETHLTATDNLDQDMALLFKSIAYVGNMILDEIKKK